MKSCKRIKKHFSDYLNGEISLSRKKRIEEHLEECNSCRAELEDLRKVANLVGSLKRIEPPLDLLVPLNAELSKEKVSILYRLPVKRLATVSIVLFITLAIVFYLRQSFLSVPSPVVSSKGLVSLVKGEAFTREAGSEKWLSVQRDMILKENDAIKTHKGAIVDINVDLENGLRLKENTEIAIQKLAMNRITKAWDFQFKLYLGQTLVKTGELPPNSRLVISTPSAIVTAHGTRFSVGLTPDQRTETQVLEGRVEVASARKEGPSVIVDQSQKTTVSLNQPPSAPESLELKEIKALEEINQIEIDEEFVKKVGREEEASEEARLEEKPAKGLLGNVRFWEVVK